MDRLEFYSKKLEKAGTTLKGLAGLVTQSFEIEAMTKKDAMSIRENLRAIGAGSSRDKSMNEGNGWNDDCHHDMSLTSYSNDHGGLYGTETSASPIDTLGWGNLKDELQNVMNVYKQASGGVYHTCRGSVHVHNTVSYTLDNNYNPILSVRLDEKRIHNILGKFFLKFMPVMKWLTMTDKMGARGNRGSNFDRLSNDALFDWYRRHNGELTDNSSYNIENLDRGSYLRIFNNGNIVHWENRMCDTTFEATHLAMWLSINKAITLLALDFARNELEFKITPEEVSKSKDILEKFYDSQRGYKAVNKAEIVKMYREFVSYLAKYLKIIGSLEAVSVMDKLIQCPISQWIDENGYDRHWNTELIERVFNTRNRAVDGELRAKYIHAIKSMHVESTDSLDEFHTRLAEHLQVESKKVKSLYQMFKRENVEIEYLGGRLVYMGD